MPRKPTPSILADGPTSVPDDELLFSPAEVASPMPDAPTAPAIAAEEISPPTQPEAKAPAKPRSSRKTPLVAEPEAVAEQAAVEPAAAVEAVVEVIDSELSEPEVLIEEIPAESDEAGGISVSIKLPEALTTAMGNMPAPVSNTLRIAVLASLGLASYAIETSVFVITKLVERGELTQKEGLKLMGEMSKRVKLPIPGFGGSKGEADVAEVEEAAPAESEEAAAEPASDELLTAEFGVGELSESSDDAGEDEQDETDEQTGNVQTNTNVLSLHVFNIGSPVEITLPKPKKKSEVK